MPPKLSLSADAINWRTIVVTALLSLVVALAGAWANDVNSKLHTATQDHATLQMVVDQNKSIEDKIDKLIDMHLKEK